MLWLIKSNRKCPVFQDRKLSPSKEPHKLRELSDLLCELEAAKLDGYLTGLSYFDTARGVSPIVEKLPFHHQEKWTAVGSRFKEGYNVAFPPFSFFSEFVRKEARARNDPSFTTAHLSSVSSKKERLPGHYSTRPSVTVTGRKSGQCPIHHKPHPLKRYRGFQTMLLSDEFLCLQMANAIVALHPPVITRHQHRHLSHSLPLKSMAGRVWAHHTQMLCLGSAHTATGVSALKTHVLDNGRPSFLTPCDNRFSVKENFSLMSHTKATPQQAQSPNPRTKPAVENLGETVFCRTVTDNQLAPSVEDTIFLKKMEGVFKDESNSWVAPLPFRSPRRLLPDNRPYAYKWLIFAARLTRRKTWEHTLLNSCRK